MVQTTAETIRSQLHLDVITIRHAGGVFTLTPDQGAASAGGGELVVDALGKAVVK